MGPSGKVFKEDMGSNHSHSAVTIRDTTGPPETSHEEGSVNLSTDQSLAFANPTQSNCDGHQNASQPSRHTVSEELTLTCSEGDTSNTLVSKDDKLGKQTLPYPFYTDVIELVQGQHKVHVHKRLLCSLSGYVAKLAGEHIDSETISLNVNAFSPQLDESTLARFVNWIYRNQLYENAYEDSFSSRCGELINLYVLARRWDLTILKNVVIDSIIGCFDDLEWLDDDGFPTHYLETVYKYTAPGDPFRRLWVDLYLFNGDDSYRTYLESDTINVDLLKDLSIAQFDFIRDGRQLGFEDPPYREDSSTYHQRDHEIHVCCCRKDFGEVGHEHRSEYLAWKHESSEDTVAYHEELVQSLSFQLGETRKNLHKKNKDSDIIDLRSRNTKLKTSLEEMTTKVKTLEDEAKNAQALEEQTKARIKGLEEQLEQANTKWRKVEDDSKARTKGLEDQIKDLKIGKSRLQSEKDRECNTLKAKIKALEKAAEGTAKRLEAYTQDAENTKRRKMDQDWRHDGGYYGSH